MMKVLLKQEGCEQCNYSNSYPVIDVDELEKQRVSGDRKKTVDAAFALIRENDKRMALVEMKCNVKNPRSLPESSLQGKIDHSKVLLKSPPYEKNIFVFKKNQISQGRGAIERLFKNKVEYQALTTKELYDTYFK